MDELDFYTKTEINEMFGVTETEDTGRDFYTKTEIIAKVGTPETLVLPADMLDFYTKTEIDSISADPWGQNIFDTLTFSSGWLDTDGNVNHQTLENYGTSDFFERGNNTKVRVSFTPQYTGERGVMVCAYDENQTFIGSPIYASMKPPYTLEEKEFIGEIPSGAVYLRYSYLWGRYPELTPGDLNTAIQLAP